MLLTDGEDNDTGALEAAQNAAKAGLKIFTIGIGTAAGDLLRVTEANGNSDYVRDEQGNVVKSHLNEALLQQIAGAAGGFYLPLRGANAIDTLYERGLAPLPKSEGRERLVRRYHEQYHWPLALAMLLLLAELFLPERKCKVRADHIEPAVRKVEAIHARDAGWRFVALLVFPVPRPLRRRARCANTNRVITRMRCRNLSGSPR